MRRLVFAAMSALGVVHATRFLHRNTLTILLYHGVAPHENRDIYGRRNASEMQKSAFAFPSRGARNPVPPEGGIYNYRGKFIEPRHFESQMKYFARHYTFVGLDEGMRLLREKKLPPYALAVTFDDGYRNFYSYAYPVLKRLHIPATMFLATDFVFEKKPLWVDRLEYAGNKENDLLKRLSDDEREERVNEVERQTGTSFPDFEGERAVYAPLSEEEIRSMQGEGIVFGAHTKSHPILSRLSPERIAEEIEDSKASIERACGKISNVFAYPNGQQGDWNETTERALRAAGFDAALTTIEGVNTDKTHPLRLRRMTMDGTDDGPAFAAIASGVRAWISTVRRYAN